MKKIKYILYYLLAAVILLSVMPTGAVFADSEESLSMTVQYSHDGVGFEGLSVRIYRIGEMKDDGEYPLTEKLDGYPVVLNGVSSQAEWKSIAATLNSYITADGVEPDFTATTDGDGNAVFADIPKGIYLVSAVNAEKDGETFSFEQFVTFVPYGEADGDVTTDVLAKPKYQRILPPEGEREIKITKQWRDSGAGTRPASVKVEILRNGESFREITLSADNNWSYSFTVADDTSTFDAVERAVADGYTVSIARDGDCIIITNTAEPEEEEIPPVTGDDTEVALYAVLMGVSGALLVLGAMMLRRIKE